MRVFTIAVLALAVSMPSVAAAADKATGWKNWADHAERIADAGESGDYGQRQAACEGSTRTIISQGFQFPYWGQMLPLFCNVHKKENRKRKVTMKEWRQECGELRRIARELAKATPVDVEPRAKPAADRLVAVLQKDEVRECTHKPERD